MSSQGPEFGDGIFPGLVGKDYIWLTLSTYDTFIAKGLTTFRINFSMERLIPNQLTGQPDATYLAALTQQVNYITSMLHSSRPQLRLKLIHNVFVGRGGYAMINPHNYGRYYGKIITDTAGFGAFWKTLAAVCTYNEGYRHGTV